MENERVELDELESKIRSKRDLFNLFKFNSGYGFYSAFLFVFVWSSFKIVISIFLEIFLNK